MEGSLLTITPIRFSVATTLSDRPKKRDKEKEKMKMILHCLSACSVWSAVSSFVPVKQTKQHSWLRCD